MANKLSEFKDWLGRQRHFRTAWFAKDPQLMPEPEEALAKLPDDVADELKTAVNELPPHPQEQKAILEALDEAIAHWREHPQVAHNSMVILAHPVSSVSRILMESLIELRAHKEQPMTVNLLDWTERPADSTSLQQKIKENLCLSNKDTDINSDHQDIINQNVLAVIPNLCWCFLRSSNGLDSIDYLQETLLSDRSQFWVIGSGQVGWEYLKSTLKLHAYCGDTIIVPRLTGEQIQSWLEPLIAQFNIHFSDAALHKRLQNPNNLLKLDISADKPLETISEVTQEISATMQSSFRAIKDKVLSENDAQPEGSPKRDYFDRLSDISDGVSVVALQLFIQSLRYQEIAVEGKDDTNSHPADKAANDTAPGRQPEQNPERQLVAMVPKLPPLPNLSQSDLYLLYSLMLHGDLSIRALAESLGDAPQVVNNQVQVLRNAGIIEQKNSIVKANPVHYPKIRRELFKNNFVIEVP